MNLLFSAHLNLSFWHKLAIKTNNYFMRIMGNGYRKIIVSSSFLYEKVKLMAVQSRITDTHKVLHKRGIC